MSNLIFNFAVLRYYHDPVTSEFLNIGVVIYSKEHRYLNAIINRRYGRLSKAFDGINRSHYYRMIDTIRLQITNLRLQFAKPTLLDDEYPDDIELLLQKVLPPDDSSLRFGGFGNGLVHDLDLELARLFSRLVEKYEGRDDQSATRRDEQVWQDYAELFSDYQITHHLYPKEIGTSDYSYNFSYTYKNDLWHPIEPISFDLMDESYIKEKANKWIGRSIMLADSNEIGTLYFLLGEPRSRPELLKAYESAANSLEEKIPIPVRIIKEREINAFVKEFADFIKIHEAEDAGQNL